MSANTRYGLFDPGQTLVVGVSGGPDSTALLHVLVQLRAEYALRLIAAHLNHGFRGAEADADADYVRQIAAAWNVPCHTEQLNVPELQRLRHLSAQEAARQARHAFLRRVAAETGADRIALAHTRDDRIETILLNLFRGAGMEGLTGFPPRHLPLIRPLYLATRADVEAYCARHDLTPRADSSNANPDYRRNRLRTELLPYLRSYYNVGVTNALWRMAELISADNHVLEDVTQEHLAEIATTRQPERITLDRVRWLALPIALRRRTLRQSIAEVRGSLYGIAFEWLEQAIRQAEQGARFSLDLPYALEMPPMRLSGEADALHIARITLAQCALPWQQTLRTPGRTVLAHAGVALEVAICDAGCAIAEPEPSARETLYFPIARCALPILARSWQPGDRIELRNLAGRKKLQDLFTDAKTPAGERGRLPVLVEAGGAGRILAVVGLRASALAWTGEEFRNAPAGESALRVCVYTIEDEFLCGTA